MPVWIRLIAPIRFEFHVSIFFFFNVYEHQLHHSYTWIYYVGDKVHSSQYLQPLFQKKILKMGPMTLFTHLKNILLQCFQFSVFSKISCIRKDPTHFENQTIDYMFFIFLTHMSNFVIIGYYLLNDAQTYFSYIILSYKNLLFKQLIDGTIIDLLESLQEWRI